MDNTTATSRVVTAPSLLRLRFSYCDRLPHQSHPPTHTQTDHQLRFRSLYLHEIDGRWLLVTQHPFTERFLNLHIRLLPEARDHISRSRIASITSGDLPQRQHAHSSFGVACTAAVVRRPRDTISIATSPNKISLTRSHITAIKHGSTDLESRSDHKKTASTNTFHLERLNDGQHIGRRLSATGEIAAQSRYRLKGKRNPCEEAENGTPTPCDCRRILLLL
ncbi:uncharacterized protein MYCGRDRAFT_89189 [Zymoseptoria tritici IPO323]|uniref:Uncharacterized protein n=1 Tax=Zymoseptoria tritici (strain CBS 115943 / IPO323) TaxID=336722 RepID=F9X000_ZYMTI|nr:uncharacterized protein MYCGRDRAFT_89189 [Zymoseptoria tritici IPO323]EGP91144.1 hypothetical protein MYCGRDRAFT_89189 [Zymoseptoria tritici IPO323]